MDATLFSLLEIAVARNLLRLLGTTSRTGSGRSALFATRCCTETIAQAAREAKRESVADYFKSVFASEVEGMFKVAEYIMKQIDVTTGKPIGLPPVTGGLVDGMPYSRRRPRRLVVMPVVVVVAVIVFHDARLG